jgi:formylglycine-generating enzyme required for sulfatase activity/tRNA A-37 threonylcarbamoyl transferase component Bud32
MPVDPGDESLFSELFCAECGGTFSLAGTDETAAHQGATPKVLGRFELLEHVGAGSFGTVWRARDKELDRIVAIKIPRKCDLDSDDTRRFLREAQAAAQLRHPNIVSVHEVGRVDDTIYIVSDFIRGLTLKDCLNDHRYSAREAAETCVRIADGLQHAHSKGVTHRDLKPSNVIIDETGDPHIVDFGLARREVGEVTVTFDGTVFGTPAYASPEQARGEAYQADGRSDIYSLGVVLFELLTGERPFRGNVQIILHHVIHDDPPSPRKLNGNVPRDLETICLKCLEKNPGRRYRTATDLGEDLRRFLNGEPIQVRPISAMERARKWVIRHPVIAGLIAGIVLLTVVAVSGITWQWQKAITAQRDHARTMVDHVLNAEPQVVASVIATLDGFRRWTDPAFRKLLAQSDLPRKHRYRANLALLPAEPERADYIFQQLLDAEGKSGLDTADIVYGVDSLRAYRGQTDDALWEILEASSQPSELRFRAALILVKLHGPSPGERFNTRIEEVASFITDGLLEMSMAAPSDYAILAESMRPVGALLVPRLEQHVLDDQASEGRRLMATLLFGEFIGDDLDRLTAVALQIKGEQYLLLLPQLMRNQPEVVACLLPIMTRMPASSAGKDEADAQADRQASAAVTLMHLGHPLEELWPLLEPSDDMRLRSFLIQRFAELQLPQRHLADRILQALESPSADEGILRALLLSLGEYPSPDQNVRQNLVPELVKAFQTHPDSGVHSAVAWLLTRWDRGGAIDTMTADLAKQPPSDDHKWFVTKEGITMAIVEDPPVFLMGSPESEPVRDAEERRHRRLIGRSYAIATHEITVAQFKRFSALTGNRMYKHSHKYGPDLNGPALSVSWVDAAKYCRWLSDVEGIDEDQKCFPEIEQISSDMKLPDDYLLRTGYRLPTEGEWECACRNGTVTRRFYGDSDRLIGKYGWYIENCHDRTWPVGMLQPNDLGLFDVYGNVWEWCVDYYGKLPAPVDGLPYLDVPKLESSKGCVLRGGSLTDRATALRSAQRDFLDPRHTRMHNVGFRIVRTVSAAPANP